MIDMECTGAEAGLSGEDQIRIVLSTLSESGGFSQTNAFYPAVESQMHGRTLSKQGKASLRFFVNKVAADAGLIVKEPPGWRITGEGRALLAAHDTEEVVDSDTEAVSRQPSNSAYGAAFEVYCLDLMKRMYPSYAWYHQGLQKHQEHGLDFVANLVGEHVGKPARIGVQVKFHAPKSRPTEKEWLKFLAGSLARRVDATVFVTTGQLSGEQVRQAQEANVVVIVGTDEVTRLARLYDLEPFKYMNRHAAGCDSAKT